MTVGTAIYTKTSDQGCSRSSEKEWMAGQVDLSISLSFLNRNLAEIWSAGTFYKIFGNTSSGLKH